MDPVTRVTGRALPLARADVDTDQIIPSSYLKRIGRTGFADGLFAAWRADPSFVLNDPRYSGATVLVAGPNFGCGSSREHAAWALRDAGFRAIVAPSFADIFRSNAIRTGLVPARLDGAAVERILRAVEKDPATAIDVDVERGRVRVAELGIDEALELDDFTRSCLAAGLDEIGLTLRRETDIAAYEAGRPAWLPQIETSEDPDSHPTEASPPRGPRVRPVRASSARAERTSAARRPTDIEEA